MAMESPQGREEEGEASWGGAAGAGCWEVGIALGQEG